jgi:hypothetical protein
MSTRKQEIITFKVDEKLAEELKDLPNRSEFIRTAILSALENICPLCRGTGHLTPAQKAHWDSFLDTHKIEKCDDCQGLQIVCDNKQQE